MKKTTLLVLGLALAATTFSCSIPQKAEKIAIIPEPVSMEINSQKSDFLFSTPMTIYYDQNSTVLAEAATYLQKTLSNKFEGDITLTTDKEVKAQIQLELDSNLPDEGYELSIEEDDIEIEIKDYSGAVYALETIFQLMPEEIYAQGKKPAGTTYALPDVEIKDDPRFKWRGMHLDCSRHFFTADSVKRYLDYLVMNKLNRFHWHLTDDQGWRMESKKYPLLTEISAWRVDRSDVAWDNRTPIDRTKGEETTYGGFYSQEQIKDIVKYAKERGITIIPEIEIPGHTSEVFAAYPELSCIGKPQEVTPGGYYGENMATCFCAGNEDVFTFLENILDETMELFPTADYIHIGGDEVDKRFWRACPKCQARMKEEGLKDADELQSYFIKRIEKYLNSKGMPIIGWDEILEGGLAPNATVMSWRGIQGGIDAARAGHDVVMTPNTHMYFDYYQNTPEVEPKAMGWMVTTKQVYSFEPTIEGVLTEAESKHILGVQANLWSEFLPHFTDVERMTLPRMMAVSEIGWSPKEKKDWSSFSQRLSVNAKRLAAMGANYHKGCTALDFKTSYDETTKAFTIEIISEIYDAEIRYTTDGSEPTISSPLYTEPISINKTTDIKAILTLNGEVLSTVPTSRTIGYHKALGKTITYNLRPSDGYRGNNGDKTLIDGFTGSPSHNDGYMQGFNNYDFDVVINLEEPTEVQEVIGSFLMNVGTWIYFPKELVVSVSSDGENYTEMGRATHNYDPFETQVARHQFKVNFTPTTTQYIKVVGVNPPTVMGLPGGGTVNWMFADEIFVN